MSIARAQAPSRKKRSVLFRWPLLGGSPATVERLIHRAYELLSRCPTTGCESWRGENRTPHRRNVFVSNVFKVRKPWANPYRRSGPVPHPWKDAPGRIVAAGWFTGLQTGGQAVAAVRSVLPFAFHAAADPFNEG